MGSNDDEEGVSLLTEFLKAGNRTLLNRRIRDRKAGCISGVVENNLERLIVILTWSKTTIEEIVRLHWLYIYSPIRYDRARTLDRYRPRKLIRLGNIVNAKETERDPLFYGVPHGFENTIPHAFRSEDDGKNWQAMLVGGIKTGNLKICVNKIRIPARVFQAFMIVMVIFNTYILA